MRRTDTDEDLRSSKEDNKLRAGPTHRQIRELKLLKKLSWRALKVYIVLLAHMNFTTWLCWPPYTVIAKETGITSGVKIGKAIKELEDHKLVAHTARRFIGREGAEYGHERNVYEVLWRARGE